MITFRNISCTSGHFPYEFGARFCGKHNFRGGSLHSREDRKESGRHHAKGTRYVANSLAALLGASAAIWSSGLLMLYMYYRATKLKRTTKKSKF